MYLKRWYIKVISKLTNAPTFLHLITAMKAYAFEVRTAEARLEALGVSTNYARYDHRPSTQFSNQRGSNRVDHNMDNSKQKGGNSKDNTSSYSRDNAGPTIYSTHCDHCGSNRHNVWDCMMSYHPDYNPDPNIKWEDSDSCRRMKEKNPEDSDSWYLKRWFDISGNAIPKRSDPNYVEKSKKSHNNNKKYN